MIYLGFLGLICIEVKEVYKAIIKFSIKHCLK